MSEERTRVLEMLAEGKITAEEADMLLQALKDEGSSQTEAQEVEGRGGLLDWIVSLFGAKATYKEELDWTLDGAGLSLIKAETDNGSISLSGADQDQVTVRAWKQVRALTEAKAEEFARQVQVHAERNGDTIRIYKEHPRPPAGYTVSVRYEISGPRNVGASLRTSNGAVYIHEIDGAVEAVTSNGAIELQGGAGSVDLCTSNGAIQVQDAEGSVRAKTSNGRITALLGQLQEGVFSTSNGAIKVDVRQGNAPLTARTSNGAVEVALPAGFSGLLDAKTTNGRVHSELPLSGVEGSRTRLVGQIGQGGETTVKLRTLNGSIRVKARQ